MRFRSLPLFRDLKDNPRQVLVLSYSCIGWSEMYLAAPLLASLTDAGMHVTSSIRHLGSCTYMTWMPLWTPSFTGCQHIAIDFDRVTDRTFAASQHGSTVVAGDRCQLHGYIHAQNFWTLFHSGLHSHLWTESVCLVDRISDTRSQGYTNLQSLVKCLDRAQYAVKQGLDRKCLRGCLSNGTHHLGLACDLD